MTLCEMADIVNGGSGSDYWLHWYEPVVVDLRYDEVTGEMLGRVGDRRRKRYFWQSYVVLPQ